MYFCYINASTPNVALFVMTSDCRVCSHGDSYNGDWVAGRRHGHGILHCTDGTHYDVRVCQLTCCVRVYVYMCELINVLITGAVE